MSIAQAVKMVKESTVKPANKKNILFFGLNFILAFLFSFSGFSKEFSPFGVAFCGSANRKYLTASALGASIGYVFFSDSISSLRYVASILAILVIFSALKPFKEIRENIMLPVISTFVCLFVTGLAVLFSAKFNFLNLIVTFCECVFGACATYLFSECRIILSLKGSLKSLTSKEAIYLILTFSLLILALKDVVIFGISVANIISVLIILICSKYAHESGGTIVGVAFGITLSLSVENLTLLAFFSLGGLLAGVVSKLGKIATFIGFILAGILVSVITYENTNELKLVFLAIESVIAGIIFLFLPQNVNNKLKEILSPAVTSPIIESVKGEITRKLKNASEISTEIFSSLNVVTDALNKNDKADLKKICKKTKESVCGSCGLYDACWSESFEDTEDCFNTLITMKKEGKYLENKTIPSQFASKCIRTEMISSSFNKLYSEYVVKQRLETRVNEIQTLASEQFINVSSLLDSLCEKVSEDVRFDMDIAAKTRSAASSCGLNPIESCCIINSLEKINIELKIETTTENYNFKPLLRQLEIVTNKKLDYPQISIDKNITTLLFKEKADYRVKSAGIQFSATGEKYSGDTYATFTDDNGVFYSVICDGMGTGTRAAINSNLAISLLEKLIKAGFGINSAINTVNTSLISKSNEECSVTLDLTAIDLFTGHIEFYKCGASETVVKKQRRIHLINAPSLPLGILKDSEISYGSGTIFDGDMLIMASDGVKEDDYTLLQSELRYFNGENLRDFTNKLAESIRDTQTEKKDDLTIVSLQFLKND